ncbi:hypothetical protein GCM10017673_23210 [Streptosporangium violaceochromogenes]|nr:hypothetical protein GCM10017673_23210 [Streptosporangium violaceochromogenes]
MTPLRALLALGLLTGLYLLCLVLVIADIGLVVLSVETSITLGRPLQGNAALLLMATIPTLWALYGVFTLRAPSGPEPGSLPVEPDQAPALWAVVRGLAAEIGTRPPAEIRLVAEVNAKVTEETAFLGLVGGTRRLYIGLPLLAGLSADELRVVLCHELGHYAHAHTRLGAITYRGHLALRETLNRVVMLQSPAVGGRRPHVNPMISWVWWPFLGYASLYFRLSSAVNRRQELQADAAAARIVGTEVAAEALRRFLGVLPVAWSAFTARCLDPMRARGCVPDDPLAVFAAMAAGPGRPRELEERLEARLERDGAPGTGRAWKYDSHPSPARRLRALAALGGPARVGERDPRPSAERFPCRPPASPDVRRCLMPDLPGGTAVLPWREWLELTAETLATEPARRLVRAVHQVGGPTRPALETALDLLGSGAGGRLAACLSVLSPVAEGGGPEEDDGDGDAGRLESALFALVGQALVARGRARWEMPWPGFCHLVWTERGARAAGGVTVERLREVVGAAAAGGLAEAERLRLYLGVLGVDPGAWLSQDAEGARQSGAPSETMTVPAAADPATREEDRKRLVVGLASIGFVAVLFLLTAVPSPFAGKSAPIPGSRPWVVLPTPMTVPTAPMTFREGLWQGVSPSPTRLPGLDLPDLHRYEHRYDRRVGRLPVPLWKPPRLKGLRRLPAPRRFRNPPAGKRR